MPIGDVVASLSSDRNLANNEIAVDVDDGIHLYLWLPERERLKVRSKRAMDSYCVTRPRQG